MMFNRFKGRIVPLLVLSFLALFPKSIFGQQPSRSPAASDSVPRDLLPKPSGWKESEPSRTYAPDSLFEYIDGAAESFLAYDFRELIVDQLVREGSAAGSLTIEIYDLGAPRNAFGIYSAERYPDSRFIPAGTQGYYEEGSLNFLAGRYYVKMMCYDCGSAAEGFLTGLADSIAGKVPDKPGLPPILSAFPRSGLVANSEKFIRRNFQGLSFLENGFQASYKVDNLEFECFIIESRDAADAAATAGRYLENFAKGGLEIKAAGPGSTFKDKYFQHVFVAQVGRFVAGVSRIPDGKEELGRSCLKELVHNLGGAAQTAGDRGGR
jgi:hypothetical protein